MKDYRQQSDWEQRLFAILLAPPFPGRDQLALQLRSAAVRQIDANGSLEIHASSGPDAVVLHRIPVEADGRDADGQAVYLLLHVVSGRADELEIFRTDGGVLQQRPAIESLGVTPFPPARE
jgi:hypothetical protein